ncbi:MAG: thioesterase family protein [Thermodesulfovibrionales bacterium]|jgi:fluoroacetyl-CoA thioesterase
MADISVKAGLTHEMRYIVPDNKTVPCLFPESPEFSMMPKVLATGFMIGLFEWACIQAINPFIDWPNEQSVGTGVNVTHEAATPPGLEVTVRVKLERVEERKLSFSIVAHDGIEKISEGTHERFIIVAEKFNEKVKTKACTGSR